MQTVSVREGGFGGDWFVHLWSNQKTGRPATLPYRLRSQTEVAKFIQWWKFENNMVIYPNIFKYLNVYFFRNHWVDTWFCTELTPATIPKNNQQTQNNTHTSVSIMLNWLRALARPNHITSHPIPWHHIISSHLAANLPHYPTSPHNQPHLATNHITSQHITSPPPTHGRRLVCTKNSVWASHWLVDLRSFFRQILSLGSKFRSRPARLPLL